MRVTTLCIFCHSLIDYSFRWCYWWWRWWKYVGVVTFSDNWLGVITLRSISAWDEKVKVKGKFCNESVLCLRRCILLGISFNTDWVHIHYKIDTLSKMLLVTALFLNQGHSQPSATQYIYKKFWFWYYHVTSGIEWTIINLSMKKLQ